MSGYSGKSVRPSEAFPRCSRPRPWLRERRRWHKFQFRDASLPPIAWAPSIRRVSGGSLSRRNSSIGLARPTTARVIPPPRRPSIRPNPTEATKPLPIWRGTEISNPFPSSGESDANLTFSIRPPKIWTPRLGAPAHPKPPGCTAHARPGTAWACRCARRADPHASPNENADLVPF